MMNRRKKPSEGETVRPVCLLESQFQKLPRSNITQLVVKPVDKVFSEFIEFDASSLTDAVTLIL